MSRIHAKRITIGNNIPVLVEFASKDDLGNKISETYLRVDSYKETCVVTDTCEGWESKSSLKTEKNVIYVYSDKYSYIKDDVTGQTVIVPGLKVGDGNSYLGDKPFITDALLQQVKNILKNLNDHIENDTIHITSAEREKWNNKLNYIEPVEGEDILVFNRN